MSRRLDRFHSSPRPRFLQFSAFVLFLVMLAGTGSPRLLAADVSAGFNAANKLYEQRKFPEAAAAYQKLVESGPVSAALYFNLGNACFKSGEIGRAIAAYHQAQQLDPRDPDLRANLQFVREQIDGPTLLPNRWQRWLGRLTLNEWTILAATTLWLWLLLLALIQLRPGWKRPLRHWIRLAAVAMAALCLCAAAAFLIHSGRMAVVVTHEATVHNGPLDESQSMFTVHDGAELSVLERRNGWLKVSAGDRRVGWLKRDQVLVLPRPT